MSTYKTDCDRKNKDIVRLSNVKTREGYVYKLAFLFPGVACKDFLLHHDKGSFNPKQTRIVWVEKDSKLFPTIERRIRKLGYTQYGNCDKFASIDICDDNMRGGLEFDYVGFDPCGEITPGMLANLARMSLVTSDRAKVCMTFKFVGNHYTQSFLDLFERDMPKYKVLAKKRPKASTIEGLGRSYNAVMKAWSEYDRTDPILTIYRDTTTWMMNVEFSLRGHSYQSEHPEIKTTFLKHKIETGKSPSGYVSDFIEETQCRIDGLKPRVVKPAKWAWDIFNKNSVKYDISKVSGLVKKP